MRDAIRRGATRCAAVALLVLAAGALLHPVDAVAHGSPSPSDPPSSTASPPPDSSSTQTPASPTDTTTPSTAAPSSPSASPTSPTMTPAPSVVAFPSSGGGEGRFAATHRPSIRAVRKHLRDAEDRRGRRRRWKGWAPDPRWGAYGTTLLDRVAAEARRRGWTEAKIAGRIYAPFIVEGPATWSDSWGAPRWTGGYHPHHGQDVLCRYGAPVIAEQDGTVEFGSDPLGGRTLRLVRPDGSFWYYAHLRSYASGLSSGAHVRTGSILARCGASGDASVPHVHFAFFDASGVARDPMRDLVGWLDHAEHHARALFARKVTTRDPRPLPRVHVHGARPTPEVAVTQAVIAEEAWSPRRRALGVVSVSAAAGAGWLATIRRRRRPRRSRSAVS